VAVKEQFMVWVVVDLGVLGNGQSVHSIINNG